MLQKTIQIIHWLRAGRIRRSVAFLSTYLLCLIIYYSIVGYGDVELWHIGLILIAGIASAIYLYWHYPIEKTKGRDM
jgi:hypothetical protein